MITEKITLEKPERFAKPHEISRKKLIRAAEAATDKLEELSKKYGIGFPRACSFDYKYVPDENKDWICGMYTGSYWLAYQITENKFFRDRAEEMLPTFKRRYDEKIGMDNHDVGFVFTPSAIAAYKLTGNESARKLALDAVEYYYNTSYSKEGKFIIRSHRGWEEGWGCRTMMDSLMNIPLLFWASEETGDSKYREAALAHAKTTEQYLIRNDGSSYHHYQFDPKNAQPVKGLTFQGHRDESTWSRGHAWGVYGFPIAYSYCKEEFLKNVHQGITYFMLNHLAPDMVPYWDYDFTDGDEPRDSSAGVISACGMMEMASHLSDESADKLIFESAASQILDSTIDTCTGDIGVSYDGLICHVTHSIPHNVGIDQCAPYADFFYLEALARKLLPSFKKYW